MPHPSLFLFKNFLPVFDHSVLPKYLLYTLKKFGILIGNTINVYMNMEFICLCLIFLFIFNTIIYFKISIANMKKSSQFFPPPDQTPSLILVLFILKLELEFLGI